MYNAALLTASMKYFTLLIMALTSLAVPGWFKQLRSRLPRWNVLSNSQKVALVSFILLTLMLPIITLATLEGTKLASRANMPVTPPVTPTPTPTPILNPRRCLASNFDLPNIMKTDNRYDGYFYITNGTDETIWYNIVFKSNLGSFGPISAQVMGLPRKKTAVGFAIYKVDSSRALGTITATTTVEGDSSPCDSETHRVKVN